MADFNDLLDSQTSKWTNLFNRYQVVFLEDKFPWTYYQMTATKLNSAPIKEIIDADPKRANSQVFMYAILALISQSKNYMLFISEPELNAEFNDLLEQARMLKIPLA